MLDVAEIRLSAAEEQFRSRERLQHEQQQVAHNSDNNNINTIINTISMTMTIGNNSKINQESAIYIVIYTIYLYMYIYIYSNILLLWRPNYRNKYIKVGIWQER